MMDIISSVIDATLTLLATVAAVGSGMVTLSSMSGTVSATPGRRLEKPVLLAELRQAA